MQRDEFLSKAFRMAGEARTHSAADMLELRKNQPFIQRLGKVAVAKALAPFYPNVLQGYELFRGGCEQVVYASDSEVRKVIGSSITHDKSLAKANAKKSQLEFDLCRGYLGVRWLETYFEPVELRGVSAIMVVQSRLKPIKEFSSPEEVAFSAGIDFSIEELGQLHHSIVELHRETQFYPDIHGSNNIFLNPSAETGENQLIIIDTLPVSPRDQHRQIRGIETNLGELIAQRLAHWRVASSALQ